MLPTNKRGGSLVFVGLLFFVVVIFLSATSQERKREASSQSQLSLLRRWSNERSYQGRLSLRRVDGPLSHICKLFQYGRYFRAYDFSELRKLGEKARPGDMIELVAGTYKPHYSNMEETTGEGKCGTWPTRATSGTVYNLHGTADKMITFCGDPEHTIIDGSPKLQSGAGIQIVRSSHVRFAGFRMQNMLRSVDLQDTFFSEVLFITSSHTWHEGVRIRYNSSYNLFAHSRIEHTGKGYVGNGEGVYIGTAAGRTVDCGEASDQSNYNTIKNNTFGPHVPSENIDVKEFTTGGIIIGNRFDGSYLRGIHASISWVALKGRQYTVVNNTGTGLGVKGSGIRILKRAPTYGSDNIVRNNACHNLSDGSYCIFVDKRTTNNTVICNTDDTARAYGSKGEHSDLCDSFS